MKKIVINEVENTGLDTSEPIVNAKDYCSDLFIGSDEPMLGIVSPVENPSVVFKDGHGWKKYWGKPEKQYNEKFDTYSCVVYTIAKALVYDLRVRYGIETTISEMYNAFYAKVKPGIGTTIRKGMESFRLHGWVKDEEYPFTKETTASTFYHEPPETIKVKAKGKLKEFKINWKVIPTSHSSIKHYLTMAPVVLTGFAWASYYGEGIYFDYDNQANHAFLGIDYKDDGNIIVDDTYPRDRKYENGHIKDDFIKELDKTFKFGSAHVIWLTPKVNISLLNKIKSMFKKIARDIHGGFWFIKGDKKQKINSWLDAFGAIVDEIGISPKNNNLTDEFLKSKKDFKFFGK